MELGERREECKNVAGRRERGTGRKKKEEKSKESRTQVGVGFVCNASPSHPPPLLPVYIPVSNDDLKYPYEIQITR